LKTHASREFETCYIRRYEENTGPHHQKIRAKDRRRGGKARAKSKSLRVGIGLFLNSRLGASARLCELTKERVLRKRNSFENSRENKAHMLAVDCAKHRVASTDSAAHWQKKSSPCGASSAITESPKAFTGNAR
jgi:hypothetical protein